MCIYTIQIKCGIHSNIYLNIYKNIYLHMYTHAYIRINMFLSCSFSHLPCFDMTFQIQCRRFILRGPKNKLG